MHRLRQFVRRFSRGAGSQQQKTSSSTQNPYTEHIVKTAITYAIPLGVIAYGSHLINKSMKDTSELRMSKEESELGVIPEAIKKLTKRKKDFIKIDKINDKYKTYEYIINTHIHGKEEADIQFRAPFLYGILTTELKLTNDKLQATLNICKLVATVIEKGKQLETQLRNEMKALLQDNVDLNDERMTTLQSKLQQVVRREMEAETELYKNISKVLTPEEYAKFKDSMRLFNWSNDPLLRNFVQKKNVFVLNFDGDINASQVGRLREEITAILLNANASNHDEVMVNVRSGGGTVTGYGLAAAQLERIRQAGLKLTVCVDEVAASGGYLMACVGNRIFSSPFAVLGSIGVVTTIPNFAERLRREGVEVADITAGKYKRTMTPYKTPTEEDIAKVKSDVEDVLKLFKSFVASHRPQLQIEDIATGEVWFGKDALEKGLVDAIRTSDDVILDYIRSGADVYAVKYVQLPATYFGSLFFNPDTSDRTDVLATALSSLLHVLALQLPALLKEGDLPLSPEADVSKRYMMKYDDNDPRPRFS